jgi:hypothetical protein
MKPWRTCVIFATVAATALCSCDALHTSDPAANGRTSAQPAAAGRDLLYVTGYPGTNLYTYPNGHFVSTLGVLGFAMCSDKAGHVFVSNSYGISEYPHGGANEIAFLNGPFGGIDSCSVDPVTGRLAVTSRGTTASGVGIFRPEQYHHRWHLPHLYTFTHDPISCGYDAAGNLFVDAISTDATYLYELPQGAHAFQQIALRQKIAEAGYLQWDGKYLAMADDQTLVIHRFAIADGAAKQVGTVRLSQAREIGQFSIRGNVLINPDGSSNSVEFVAYPKGGESLKTISVKDASGTAVSTP